MFVFLIFFQSILLPSPAECNCSGFSGISEEIRVRPFIFQAKILDEDTLLLVDSAYFKWVQENPELMHEAKRTHFRITRYTTLVLEKHKGVWTSDTVEVFVPRDKGDCPVELKKDEVFLIYADRYTRFRTPPDSLFPSGENQCWTHACSRTRKPSRSELQRLSSALK